MLSLLTCLDKFHRQHQKIESLLLKLEGISGLNVDINDVFHTIEEVLKFTKEHFRDEEEIMRRLSYPFEADHRLQHEQFISTIKALCYGNQDHIIADPVDDIVKQFRSWTAHHFEHFDEELASFITKVLRTDSK